MEVATIALIIRRRKSCRPNWRFIMTSSISKLLPAFGLALAFVTAPAYAEVVKYKADLSGPGENPATTSKGTGTIEASLDTATMMLSWSGSYTGLTGPEMAAHFHGPAAMGVNAGVMVPVTAKDSPFKGTATLTAEQAKDFADGKVYFNIHTEQNKGGEIRGQMTPEK
jgi:CHRD domain